MNRISNARNLAYTMSSSLLQNLSATIVGLVSVPLAIGYWHNIKYGIWALITSLVSYLSMSNLGLNTAANILAAKNPSHVEKFLIVRRAFAVMAASLLIFSVIVTTLNALLGERFIGFLGEIPREVVHETWAAMLIFIASFIVNMPFSLVSSLFISFQKAYVDNIFSLLQVFVNFGALLVVIVSKGDFVLYAISLGVGTFFVNVGRFGAAYFYVIKPEKRRLQETVQGISPPPPMQSSSEASYKTIVQVGLRSLIVNAASIFIWNIDGFIISNSIGIEAVTPYNVTFKIYSLMFSIMISLYASIFPLISKQIGLGDWDWIKTNHRRSQYLAIALGGLAWVGGLSFGADFITVWTGSALNYSGVLVSVFLGAFVYMMSSVNMNLQFVNALNFTARGPLFAWWEAGLRIGLAVLFINLFGVPGLALSLVIATFFAPFSILPWWLRRNSQGKLRRETGFVFRHLALAIAPAVAAGILLQTLSTGIVFRVIGGVFCVGFYVVVTYMLIPRNDRVSVRERLKLNVLFRKRQTNAS